MVKIDWFAIDMDAFEEKYNEYLKAAEEHEAAKAVARACEYGECDHDRPRRKDGKPHKGRPCPQANHWYDQECRTGNALHYYHHAGFFEAIGLGYKREEVTQ